MNVWDQTEVMIRISQLYRQNRDISYSAVLENHMDLLGAAQHYFPNWGAAVTASGIDYSKVRRIESWSRDRIKKELISLNKQGEDLSRNAFERKHPSLLHAGVHYFGSWRNAITRIGLDYNKIKRPRGEWSKEKIIEEIRELKEKGVDLSWRAIRKQGYGPLQTMSNFYFGSWRRAITEAGLD